MRKMRTNIWTIGVGIVVFFLLAVCFGLSGFSVYPKDFGPNFYSALVGGCLGAAISLAVVLVGFALQRDSRSSALKSARYLFLRKEGEELKEAYIAFIDTLRIGGQHSVNLSGKSWQALKKEVWPDITTVNLVQKDVSQSSISGSYDFKAVSDKHKRLRATIEAVVLMSATSVFEGKERLIEGVLWEADYSVHSVEPSLNTLTRPRVDLSRALPVDVDLSVVANDLKGIAISTGRLLANLCELGKSIRL